MIIKLQGNIHCGLFQEKTLGKLFLMANNILGELMMRCKP